MMAVVHIVAMAVSTVVLRSNGFYPDAVCCSVPSKNVSVSLGVVSLQVTNAFRLYRGREICLQHETIHSIITLTLQLLLNTAHTKRTC